jgi:RHS repeat-associated protein
MTDANGVVTTLAYDGIGRLTTTTVDSGGIAAATTINYNTAGLISKITRPNGAYLQYTYDAAHRVIKVQDNTSSSIEYDRNNLGDVTARRIKDSGASILLAQTATFDELGRLLTFVGASSQTWTSAYDKTDNLVTVTDPRTHTFSRTFDSVNRLIRETNEDSQQVNLTLNGKDEVTNYADPRSLNTGYVRSGFGDIIRRASPDSGTTDTVYNALGLPTQITDGRGVVTNLTYDNAGRLLTKQYPAATYENLTYIWDDTAGGNKGISRLTSVGDANGTLAWKYDALGRKVMESRTTSGTAYGSTYGYDADGNVVQIADPTGHIISYTRDLLGRITAISWQAGPGGTVLPIITGVTYQPFGAVASISYANGLTLSRTYDQDYRLTRTLVEYAPTHVVYMSRRYTYDGVNLTAIADDVTAARNESYAYTFSNRLSEGDGLWGILTWGYDGVGNRTSQQLGSATASAFNYPSTNNKLASVTQGATTLRAFTHDGGGNITQDVHGGVTQDNIYNARGRLAQVFIGGSEVASYSYDALERMSYRTVQTMSGPLTTHFAYDLDGRVIADASDTIARDYIWLDDIPVALLEDAFSPTARLYFIHPDHLNRPVMMTDISQAVSYDAVFRPFGELQTLATGTATINLRFPGQFFLDETGLHHNWHRTYDASLGRYLEPDPSATFSDGLPKYNTRGVGALSRPTLGAWYCVGYCTCGVHR